MAFFVCCILHWVLTHPGRWPYQIELYSDGIILRSQAMFKTTSKAITGSQLIVCKITYLDKKRSNVLLFKKNKHENGLSLSTETNWPKEVLDEILHTLKELNMGKIYYEENQWSNPFKIGKGQNK